ncbi:MULTISPECIES: ANTAR domain-containing protein [Streptomyces]|uniref:ANTAR domain-containing protein n=1 Tax=Streptomyces TaxID=1883 RepID=UPI00067B70C3|nr:MULTISPECIES: ANTAR domain-containing protein [Streptomyces]
MEDAGVLPQLLAGLAQAAEAEERRRWAQRCAQALELEGIAASLNSELVWFSDDTSARLEDAQFTLGQGPGLAPDFDQVPYQVADLDQAADERWPQFAAEARKFGVRAVFVWPLRAGAARFGTLTGYRSRPGPLTGRQAHDGLRVADVLAGRLLAWHPDTQAQNGRGAAGAVEVHRIEVYQAAGVLSHRLGIAVDEALVRLRAQAYAADRPVTDIAHDILRELPP